MRVQRLYRKYSKGQQRPVDRLQRSLITGLVIFVLLLVQAAHPWLHPHEVIDAGVHDRQVCPISYATADFGIVSPPLLLWAVVLRQILEPQPWIEPPDFLHPLAPRPPPTSLS